MSGAEPAQILSLLVLAGSLSQVPFLYSCHLPYCSVNYCLFFSSLVASRHVLNCSILSYSLLNALSCVLFYAQSSCISHFSCNILDRLWIDLQNGITYVNCFLSFFSYLCPFPISFVFLLFNKGPGVCKIKVTTPEGTDVGLRSPLLPFEASHTTGKFTGGRLLKRSKKGGEKAYGWRA